MIDQSPVIPIGGYPVKQASIKKGTVSGLTIVSKSSSSISSSDLSSSTNTSEKKYVASKSGKLYYTVTCSGAKRIADKNKIYFSTSGEAEKSGYKFAAYCK